MSIDTAIADLAARASSLLDQHQGLQANANAQIAAIAAAYNARINSMVRTVYLDAQTGLDTNTGNAANAAYKTVERAVTCIPPGGAVDIYVLGDVEMLQNIDLLGRSVRFIGSNERRTISFRRYWAEPNVRGVRGFLFLNSGAVSFSNMLIRVPLIDGEWVGSNDYGHASIFRALYAAHFPVVLGLHNTHVDLPQTPFAPLIHWQGMAIVQALSITMVGRPLAGWLHGIYTSTAGTTAANARGVFTNLATI
jgi:hypothetical protein